METPGNLPQYNQNSFPWDNPPPPHPPPCNFGFAGDGFHRRIFHNTSDFPVGDHQFHHFNDHSHKPHIAGKRRLGYDDRSSYPKLFVGGITRTATRDEIRHLFEEHGNVAEVILFQDRITGLQKEFCFVKYASIEEAERAITALHDQVALPGATAPLRVRYADGERERLGLVLHDSTFSGTETAHKVYVNGLNREASQEEILEIFSSYGVVVDVYLMRDYSRQSRGCGFVGFSERNMAVAAINGLDRKYVMRGCDCPLAVRFAEPKKQKYGELRATSISADIRGSNWPNASHQDNSSGGTPESSGILSPAGNQLQRPAFDLEQCRQQSISPSHLQVKQLPTLQVSVQSSCQVDSQQQTQSHFNPTSSANIERRHDSQSPKHFGDFVEANSGLYALCGSDIPEASGDYCDWSEHICPDGYKYYFNCVTCETRWEKPEEFSLYERQLQKQRLHNPSSTSEPSFCEGACQVQTVENQKQPSDFENPLPISFGLEQCEEQTPMEASALDGPALIK